MKIARHGTHGTDLADWIDAVPAELDVDAVGLWQLVPVFRHDFLLSDTELRRALSKAIAVLWLAGARPVKASAVSERDWESDLSYGTTLGEVTRQVCARWTGVVEPTVGDLWFARID